MKLSRKQMKELSKEIDEFVMKDSVNEEPVISKYSGDDAKCRELHELIRKEDKEGSTPELTQQISKLRDEIYQFAKTVERDARKDSFDSENSFSVVINNKEEINVDAKEEKSARKIVNSFYQRLISGYREYVALATVISKAKAEFRTARDEFFKNPSDESYKKMEALMAEMESKCNLSKTTDNSEQAGETQVPLDKMPEEPVEETQE